MATTEGDERGRRRRAATEGDERGVDDEGMVGKGGKERKRLRVDFYLQRLIAVAARGGNQFPFRKPERLEEYPPDAAAK